MLENKTILLTGGTGSFGKAFVKKALEEGVKQIRVFSRDELKQHEMSLEFKDPRIEFLLGDVRDFDRLKMAAKGCDIIIHAAALKRIEKAERDPEEAIKTNIVGSINVAKAALEVNAQNAVLISTDKACEPINLYGATKMVAEKYWIQANGYRGTNHRTVFTVVRYGNVLNSRGSVVPIFKKQAKDGVINVTHPEMTRFLIQLEQAVDLVQIALTYGQGGEVYIPHLKSANIVDLARAVDENAEIKIVGTNPSEKLHEQLFNQSEANYLVYESGYCYIEPEHPKWPYRCAPAVAHEPPLNSNEVEKYNLKELKDML